MPLAHPAVLLIEGDGGLQLWKKDRGSDDTKRSLTPTLARSSLFCLVLSCVAFRGGLGKLAVSPQVHVHSVNPRGLVARCNMVIGHIVSAKGDKEPCTQLRRIPTTPFNFDLVGRSACSHNQKQKAAA